MKIQILIWAQKMSQKFRIGKVNKQLTLLVKRVNKQLNFTKDVIYPSVQIDSIFSASITPRLTSQVTRAASRP